MAAIVLCQTLSISNHRCLKFLLLTTVIRSIIPLLASYFIDHYVHQVTDGVLLVLGGYFGLYILQMLFQYIGNFGLLRFLTVLFEIFARMPFLKWNLWGWPIFDQTPSGSIVSRLTNDTESISEMFSGILSSFISAIFVVAVTLYTMFALDWKLTSLIVLFLPIIFILVNMYRKKSAPVVEKHGVY